MVREGVEVMVIVRGGNMLGGILCEGRDSVKGELIEACRPEPISENDNLPLTVFRFCL
jgi:hypothetical protein